MAARSVGSRAVENGDIDFTQALRELAALKGQAQGLAGRVDAAMEAITRVAEQRVGAIEEQKARREAAQSRFEERLQIAESRVLAARREVEEANARGEELQRTLGVRVQIAEGKVVEARSEVAEVAARGEEVERTLSDRLNRAELEVVEARGQVSAAQSRVGNEQRGLSGRLRILEGEVAEAREEVDAAQERLDVQRQSHRKYRRASTKRFRQMQRSAEVAVATLSPKGKRRAFMAADRSITHHYDGGHG